MFPQWGRLVPTICNSKPQAVTLLYVPNIAKRLDSRGFSTDCCLFKMCHSFGHNRLSSSAFNRANITNHAWNRLSPPREREIRYIKIPSISQPTSNLMLLNNRYSTIATIDLNGRYGHRRNSVILPLLHRF